MNSDKDLAKMDIHQDKSKIQCFSSLILIDMLPTFYFYLLF